MYADPMRNCLMSAASMDSIVLYRHGLAVLTIRASEHRNDVRWTDVYLHDGFSVKYFDSAVPMRTCCSIDCRIQACERCNLDSCGLA